MGINMQSWVGPLRRAAKKLAFFSLGLLSERLVTVLVRSLCAMEAARRPPEQALRFLLQVESDLYPLLGRAAVAHGRGTHVKHRLIGYHDFFVRRLTPGQRVLDVGCGVGALAHDLAERARAVVTAVDQDPLIIAQARALHPHPTVEYLVADATQALSLGQFQVLVLSNVLEHLDQRPRLLRTLVANHGPQSLLIRVPLYERDWRVALRRELGLEWRLDNTHQTEYTFDSFAQEMAEAGLGLSHVEVRWGEIWAEARPLAEAGQEHGQGSVAPRETSPILPKDFGR